MENYKCGKKKGTNKLAKKNGKMSKNIPMI